MRNTGYRWVFVAVAAVVFGGLAPTTGQAADVRLTRWDGLICASQKEPSMRAPGSTSP